MRYEFPKTDKPLAFCYVRMSTAIQLHGDSLRRQTQNAKRYASENGLHFIDDFKLEDIGVSGFGGANAEKGVLADFLEAVKSGAIPHGSYLILESLDRLSRDHPLKAFGLFSDILEANINIVTLLDNQVYRNKKIEFQQLMTSILHMSLAHEESVKKSERGGASWQNKRNNLDKEKLTSKCPAWLRLNETRTSYELNHDRVAVIRLIFDMAQKGDGSYVIARELNERGIKPFGRSGLWGKSSVTKILTSNAVYGEFQAHRLVGGKRLAEGDPISNYFPAIIDEKSYRLVQAGRKNREIGSRGRKGNKVSNLFTNLAKCAYCKGSMHFINKGEGPKGGHYLKCYRAMSSKTCSSVAWRYDDFEESFLYFCRELDLSALARETEKRREKALAAENLQTAQRNLDALIANRDSIFDLIKKVSTDYVAARLQEVEEQIVAAKAEVAAASDLYHATDADIAIDDDQLLAFINAFRSSAGPDNVAQRRNLLRRIGESVEYLFLAPAGNRPLEENAQAIMLENAHDEDDRQRILRYMESVSNLSREIDGPFFRVGMTGQIHRLVQVSKDDPTKLVTLVDLENGNVSAYKGGPMPFDFVENDFTIDE